MHKRNLYIGETFGDWTVISEQFKKDTNSKTYYVKCRCACTKVFDVNKQTLYNGKTRKCKLCVKGKATHELTEGDKVKNWTIVNKEFIKKQSFKATLRCDCGYEKEWLSTSRGDYKYKECPKCLAYQEQETVKGSYLQRIKTSAVDRSLEFDLTKDYIFNLLNEQQFKCAYSNIQLYFAKSNKEWENRLSTASLDRIKPSEGYIEGNVQWVHKDINRIKSTLTHEAFIYWCNMVAKQHPI